MESAHAQKRGNLRSQLKRGERERERERREKERKLCGGEKRQRGVHGVGENRKPATRDPAFRILSNGTTQVVAEGRAAKHIRWQNSETSRSHHQEVDHRAVGHRSTIRPRRLIDHAPNLAIRLAMSYNDTPRCQLFPSTCGFQAVFRGTVSPRRTPPLLLSQR